MIMIPTELIESRGRPISPKRMAFLEQAYSHLNKVCLWGQKGPDMFDCSGLVTYSLWATGNEDWRAFTNAAGLWEKTQPVSFFEMIPGDLAMYVPSYGDRTHIIHVVIMLAGWQVLSASGATSTITSRDGALKVGAKVRTHDSIWYRPGFVGIRRLPQF